MTKDGSPANTTFMKTVRFADLIESNFEVFCQWQSCDSCLIKRKCKSFIRKIKKVRDDFHEIKRQIEVCNDESRKNSEEKNKAFPFVECK